MESRSNKFKRYAISSGITFITVFLLTFVAKLIGVLEAGGTLTADILLYIVSGAVAAGARALLKYLNELLLTIPMPVAKGKKASKKKNKR